MLRASKRSALLLGLLFIGVFYVSIRLHELPPTLEKREFMPQYFTKPEDADAPWIEQVSWEPRIFVYHNFLTVKECKEIRAIGEAHVSRSLVVGATGKSEENAARSSSGVFFGRQFMVESPLLRVVEKRIADWTKVPIEHGEAFYLIRYTSGQEYKPHLDWFDEKNGKSYIGNSGNRIATVLTYLHTPEEGGDTIFPNAKGGKLSVQAKAGDAVLFWDFTPNSQPDPNSLHGGSPVIRGEKWSMTKWIRAKPTEYGWRKGMSETEIELLDKKDQEYLTQRF